jgi:hypothetical protein
VRCVYLHARTMPWSGMKDWWASKGSIKNETGGRHLLHAGE